MRFWSPTNVADPIIKNKNRKFPLPGDGQDTGSRHKTYKNLDNSPNLYKTYTKPIQTYRDLHITTTTTTTTTTTSITMDTKNSYLCTPRWALQEPKPMGMKVMSALVNLRMGYCSN